MKNAYWGYWLIMLGIFVVVIMMLASDATTTNTQDYYQLKEVANSALYDSLDYSYYSQTKQVRILKEIFVENFLRRFSETISPTDSYTVQFYDLYESPPKVSVKIATSTAGFIVGRDTGEDAVTSLDVVNSIDLIIELKANDPTNCGSDVSCDRSLITSSQCPYYGAGAGSTYNPGSSNTGNTNPGNNNPTNPTDPSNPTNPTNPTNPGNTLTTGDGGTVTTPPANKETNVCSDPNMVEFDVSGLKAYNMIDVNFKTAPNVSQGQVSMPPGSEFTVAGRSKTEYNGGYYWLVKKSDGQCGWVYEPYMAVNLYTYITNMNYEIYNASHAVYKSKGTGLSNIAGVQLYTNDYKPIATYSFALKLKSAANAARSNNDVLLVNDAYRPRDVSRYIYNKAQSQSIFMNNVGGHPSWFLSNSVSKHNTGCAVDITIVNADMPTDMHEVSVDAMKYTTWDTSQNKSLYTDKMKQSDDAKRLHNYMQVAGLQDLPSEWWHYQDDACHQRLSSKPANFWAAVHP